MWWVLLHGVTTAWAQEEEPGRIEGKPGKGITLVAPGDAASMNVKARFQLRATELFPTDPEEDALTEILIRRARLSFSGHAWSPDLTYLMQLSLSVRDLESDLPRPLLDAYLNWAPVEAFELRAGQGIVPFSRARVTSSSSFQLVDRSIVVSELNLDRDVGVTLHSGDIGFSDGVVGYAVGLYGGEGRNRLGTIPGYLGVARVSLRPFGGFDDLVEGDLKRDPKPRLALGANVGYDLATNRQRATHGDVYEAAHFDYLNAGADLVFKWHGLYLTGEALLRDADRDRVTTDGLTEYSRSAWGWFVQGGQMLTKEVEVAARYGQLLPFDGTDPELTEQREVGGGASWYIEGHALKIQTDYFYLSGETFEGGEHQVRTELQITI